MIAETSIDFSYQAIGWLVVGLAALCVAINQIDDFFERRQTKPGNPPNEVLSVSQGDLSRRVEALEGKIMEKEWFAKIQADIETVRIEANTRSENRDRIDSTHRASIYRAIGESRQQMNDHIEKVRTEVTGKMEDARRELTDAQRALPNEIVTLLKNTNAI